MIILKPTGGLTDINAERKEIVCGKESKANECLQEIINTWCVHD